MITPLPQNEDDAIESGKMRLLGQLLGSIIHEVNNPLAIGMGRMSQLKNHIDMSDPNVQKMTGSITLQFERMRDILLAAKRLAIFGQNRALETITAKRVVSDIEILLAERCRRHSVTFVFDDPTAWQVEGNLDGVVTLLVAILLEAVEFLKTQEADERRSITILFSNLSIALSWPFERSFVVNEFIRGLIPALGLTYAEAHEASSNATCRCVLTFSN